MKALFILLLTVSLSFGAGIRMAIVEKIAGTPDQPEWIRIVAYGILPNGEPKEFELKTAKGKLASDNIENCALFNLNRKAIRYIIYLHEADVTSTSEDGVVTVVHKAGEPKIIDFHMEETFEQKIFTEFDEQTLIRIAEAKAYLESQ